jgi:hypothetical protein
MIPIKMIPLVDIGDPPQEVKEYCDEYGISMHGQNDVILVSASDEEDIPMCRWLKSLGVVFGERRIYVALIAD